MSDDFGIIEGTMKLKGQGGSKVTSTTDGAKERLDVAATLVAPGFEGVVLVLLTDPVSSGTDLAVDGSGTNVDFEYTGEADESVELTSLSLLFEDNGFKVGDNFMNESTLANGLFLEIKAQDVVLPTITMQRTRDLVEFSRPAEPFVFVGANALLRSLRVADTGIVLAPKGTFGTDDYVRLTVRDNLTGLSFGHARLAGRML